MTATGIDASTPRIMDWNAATDAPAWSFSPIRLDTYAVVAVLRPNATAKTNVNSDSVSPTVAVASAPRWATQNTLMIPNNDSIIISSTIGVARRKMARPIEHSVKSWEEPA